MLAPPAANHAAILCFAKASAARANRCSSAFLGLRTYRVSGHVVSLRWCALIFDHSRRTVSGETLFGVRVRKCSVKKEPGRIVRSTGV